MWENLSIINKHVVLSYLLGRREHYFQEDLRFTTCVYFLFIFSPQHYWAPTADHHETAVWSGI